METVYEDLRQGLRAVLKTPAFSAVAILILALSIGANTRTPEAVRSYFRGRHVSDADGLGRR